MPLTVPPYWTSVWSPTTTSTRPVREVDELPERLAVGDAADALVRDHDHGVGLRLARDARVLVRRVGAVGDLDRPEAAREHEPRRLFVDDPDHGDLRAPDVEVPDRVDARQVAVQVLQVRRDVGVRRARSIGAGRRPRKVDHRLQVGDALVEVVVAEGVDLDAHHPLGLHRRSLVEEAGERRRRAEVVTGRQRQRRIRLPVRLPARGDVPRAARRRAPRRIQVPMPVGHVQELDRHRGRRRGLLRHRDADDAQDGRRHECDDGCKTLPHLVFLSPRCTTVITSLPVRRQPEAASPPARSSAPCRSAPTPGSGTPRRHRCAASRRAPRRGRRSSSRTT